MRLLALLAMIACTTDPSIDDPVDVGTAAPSTADWSPVDAVLDATWQDAASDIPGLSLLLWDRDGTLVYSETRGQFDNSERIPVASASKLVSALTLLRLVETDVLSLDDTTGDTLGWTDDAGDVTLDHLGAFVSGFQPSHSCEFNIARTLMDCAQTVGAEPRIAEPGALFEYGGTHMAIAGAMAETQAGSDWNALFHDTLAQPLGLTHPDLRYVALPRTELGERNPRVGGGLLASPAEYGTMMSLVLAQGRLDGERFIAPELIDRLFENRYTSAEVGDVPSQLDTRPWRYSFGSWLECQADATECDVINSAGAFGTVPWIDRDTGYAGLISVYGPIGTTDFTLALEEELQPIIVGILSQDD